MSSKNKIEIRSKLMLDDHWNYNMYSCPFNVVVRLLSSDNRPLLPQGVFTGTIKVVNGELMKGDCVSGNPDLFYRSEIVAWRNI